MFFPKKHLLFEVDLQVNLSKNAKLAAGESRLRQKRLFLVERTLCLCLDL